ncbi:hydantoinase B/oxoprolinase family protein [Sphingomonas crocodyli]|uniref:5-oxoprolinase n=1 Tax=Sphingomonas crocodyli TaxID=1979270 RepID=A0A437LUX9_9SPHN|nr:hydantoinase B/oxoprolinase family protein [Sphingomonas crocodyli]RVT89168.1 5-oxoprolinase [Sphingomonas crocodyli]
MTASLQSEWRFWIDRGGTFTDVVAVAPDGTLHTAKLLSEDPGRADDAAVAAMRMLTGVAQGPLPAAKLRIGTTIATNALLERKGEPVLLAITRGFGDALTIGYQDRPDIFAREIRRPPPVHARTIEIDERVTAEGEVLHPIDTDAARAGLQAAFDDGIRAIAIVLMHGHAFPAHEAALAELAAQIGFTQISVSHRVSPLIKLIGRGDTSVVDAYLSPVLRRYVDGLVAGLGPAFAERAPLFMQSNGGLVDGRRFQGKDAILSGPAGGIVGLARTATEAGFDRVIGFDMGGTSTDVSLFAGAYERDNETIVAGARIRAPMMRIHTVAAGGGSICRFADGRFLVGPESAGAVPGPACYGRGGPLTVTDCNVMLGKIRPEYFPRLFGPSGDAPIDMGAVRTRFDALLDQVEAETGTRPTREAAAEGLIAIAVANMAQAIKAISVAKGHDVAGYTLACFGGAGGQHACLVADALGMERVMIHPLAGVLSAYGMGLADRRAVRERSLGVAPDAPAVGEAIAALGAEARADLAAQGVDAASVAIEAQLHLRHEGTDSAIAVPFDPAEGMRVAFVEEHRRRFGFDGTAPLVAEMVTVEAVSSTSPPPLRSSRAKSRDVGAGERVSTSLDTSGWGGVPVMDRADVADPIDGPAILLDPVSTIVVEPGWRCAVDGHGNLILTRTAPLATQSAGIEADPVRLEIFAGIFMGIAEEMGAALRNSASSVNIRERLDFSCALFDADGNLIANAPHIPVHLGSMGESIRTVIARRAGSMKPGDAYALNAPYDGGTHLPDITVIMPVFADEADAAPAWFVAARGHHADIGGISPGSMPPGSRTVEEEGVILDNVLLVDGGRLCEREVRTLLGGGRWPSRNVDQNIADLTAQVAACTRGASELRRLAATRGRDVVDAYMAHVQDQAEAAAARLIDGLADGGATVGMDDGAVIRVAATVGDGRLTIDFAGTSDQHPGNFNAPRSVVRAAVLYALRLLIDEAVPLNDGVMRRVDLHIPQGSMLDPRFPAAVVAGNVETSQAITDALLQALGAMAGSQGTMNNFTFGDERRQYYETIAGGSGAGPDFDGANVVQTHMTNSRLTDPEILETRFPVLVEQFSIRRGSGGAGAYRGGDGAVRRIRFREPMHAAILSNRRRIAPAGLAGGGDGATGINRVERADGSAEMLGATASVEMTAGDVFVIETPGGGGCGR